jgi:hypothetical protein
MSQPTDPTDTIAAADAAGSNFAKAFLPGLVLGLVLGLFIGAWLPPFFGEKPALVPAPPRDPQDAGERHRGEAPPGPEAEANPPPATPAPGESNAGPP